jgi:hypothetical protein
LSSGNDTGYNTHVLLDHVPHNDLKIPVASDSGYKVYFLNVNIPDIACTDCALQVINPMTDKIADGAVCTLPGNCTTKTNIYTSCADISISGTTAFGDYNWAYSPENWPYTDKKSGVYTQGDDFSHLRINLLESGTWENAWLSGQTTSLNGVCSDQVPPGIDFATSTGTSSTTGTDSTTTGSTSSPTTTGALAASGVNLICYFALSIALIVVSLL